MAEPQPGDSPTVVGPAPFPADEDETADPLIGVRVGHYSITRRLGRGGQASVYQGIDVDNGTNVALKFLHFHHLYNATLRKRFLREAQVLEGLREHPSILRVFETGEYDDFPYLVLEYMATNASELLTAYPVGLPLGAGLRIGLEMAEALEFAHGLNVLHRDIKPANILLNDIWSPAKLADFGMARAADLSPVSGSGHIFGTPRYRAPELMTGAPASPRTDIYSMGMALLDLLGGSATFQLRPQEAARMNVRCLPDPIFDILARSAAQDPGQRPETAAELAAMLSTAISFLQYQDEHDTPVVTPWGATTAAPRPSKVTSADDCCPPILQLRIAEFPQFTLLHFARRDEKKNLDIRILHELRLPESLQLRRNLGLVVSGRLPVWFYAHAMDLARTFAWVATYDTHLGGAVVVSRHIDSAPNIGSLIRIMPPESYSDRNG